MVQYCTQVHTTDLAAAGGTRECGGRIAEIFHRTGNGGRAIRTAPDNPKTRGFRVRAFRVRVGVRVLGAPGRADAASDARGRLPAERRRRRRVRRRDLDARRTFETLVHGLRART
jgi:hypothetical protein